MRSGPLGAALRRPGLEEVAHPPRPAMADDRSLKEAAETRPEESRRPPRAPATKAPVSTTASQTKRRFPRSSPRNPSGWLGPTSRLSQLPASSLTARGDLLHPESQRTGATAGGGGGAGSGERSQASARAAPLAGLGWPVPPLAVARTATRSATRCCPGNHNHHARAGALRPRGKSPSARRSGGLTRWKNGRRPPLHPCPTGWSPERAQ